KVDMDGQVAASATGWFDFKRKTFKANADVKQADLAFASKRAGALGVSELSRYSGVLSGRATAERAAPGGLISTEGSLSGRNLGVDGKPVAEGDAALDWKGVQIAGDGSTVTANTIKLTSSAANLDARGFRMRTGSTIDLSGDLTGSADLQRLFRAIAPLTGMAKPPNLAGKLGLSARLATEKKLVTMNGKGGIDQLEIG